MSDPTSQRELEHTPLEVTVFDGMPFVKCSCRSDMRAQSAVWLREHWRGDEASGIAALQRLSGVDAEVSE